MSDTVIDPPSTAPTVDPPGVPAATRIGREAPRRARAANVILGRKLRTDQEMHERLGNSTALAVFASDALSSVAYATEEMLIVLLGSVAASVAFSTIVPLSLGIVALLVILVFSYRQTIKAYPSAGGAYIVTRDNFGLLPAQIAGVALLTDYILTVAVSVSAGVAAMYSAFPEAYPYRVLIAVLLIWLIAWMNLRGVRESGRIFAVPTYLFVVSVLGLVVIGFVRAMAGGLDPIHTQHATAAAAAGGSLGLFVIMHAFASGSTAMTGVEAISNGVPAFKPVEWKNARKVMAVLGILLGTMFLGISYLAAKLHPIPSEKKTVISQIARAILGTSPLGNVGFIIMQAATMLILVLAANTSFADFPRLASFHAQDHFLPTPLTRRGRRLVFANGIIALAAMATVLTVVFQADVTHLIPLYAIGVFTSFTLSQAGMAKRHLKIKEEGWRLGLFVNGTGAVATFIVLIVISITKFTHGAWIIMIVVPVTVAVLVRVNKHYDRVAAGLNAPDRALAAGTARGVDAIVMVSRVDDGLDRAMHYVEQLDAVHVRAVHIGAEDRTLGAAFWARYGVALDAVKSDRGLVRTARELVRAARAECPDRVVAVVVPETIEEARVAHVVRHNRALRLKAGMLFEQGVVVVNVPTVGNDTTLVGRPPRNHVALVPISNLHAGAREALRVAELLRPNRVRAVHIAELPEDAEEIERQWAEAAIPVPLDVVAAPYRELGEPLLQEVDALKAEGADLVTVVIGEFVPKWWQHGLHNHRALQMKATLLFEPDVAVVSVPHHMETAPIDAAESMDEAEPEPAG
jgi:amino acid transporter